MKITVHVVIDPQDGTTPTTHEAGVIDRTDLTPATAGLHLAEAHQVLSALQQHMVTAQAQAALDTHGDCERCGRAHRHKDARTIVLRTLFGTLRLLSPRWQSCPCTPAEEGTFSPLAVLLPERTTPELLYWENTYAAHTSYDAAAQLLSQAFPLGRTLEASAIGTTPSASPSAWRTSSARNRSASSAPAPPTGRRCPARTCR